MISLFRQDLGSVVIHVNWAEKMPWTITRGDEQYRMWFAFNTVFTEGGNTAYQMIIGSLNILIGIRA